MLLVDCHTSSASCVHGESWAPRQASTGTRTCEPRHGHWPKSQQKLELYEEAGEPSSEARRHSCPKPPQPRQQRHQASPAASGEAGRDRGVISGPARRTWARCRIQRHVARAVGLYANEVERRATGSPRQLEPGARGLLLQMAPARSMSHAFILSSTFTRASIWKLHLVDETGAPPRAVHEAISGRPRGRNRNNKHEHITHTVRMCRTQRKVADSVEALGSRDGRLPGGFTGRAFDC